MNKKLGFALLVLGMSVATPAVWGNCGNDNGNGNGCSGQEGPQGPAGHDGLNGTNGSNGQNGTNGKNGVNGSDSANTGVLLVADTAVRLYDGKYTQVQIFNVYAFSRNQGDNVVGAGHNDMFGMRFVFKLGSSYEEREIARLRKQLGLK